MAEKSNTITVQRPIIAKRSSRIRASAAVKAAAQHLVDRHNASTVDPSPPRQHLSASPGLDVDDSGRIHALELSQRAIMDSLDEVKERFDELQTMINATLSDKVAMLTPDIPARSFIGMNPTETIQSHMPWVDASTLANVVSCTLDVAHFIRLIPIEERPKGQANFGLPTGVHIDSTTGKTSFVNESTVIHEKAFPDFTTLVSALTVYTTIRDFYDSDNLGFGRAIVLYIRQLALWTKHHNWSAILTYFVAHFRKHQPSANPRVWFDIDIQLFASCMTNDTIETPAASARERPQSGTKQRLLRESTEICRNWNTDKGCAWQKCIRKHICLNCAGDHMASRCTKPSKSS